MLGLCAAALAHFILIGQLLEACRGAAASAWWFMSRFYLCDYFNFISSFFQMLSGLRAKVKGHVTDAVITPTHTLTHTDS